jgi:indolepyruvate ferredoxin oxidoreductase beta subunit
MDAQDANARPISIAVLALGGEGGGVLADWIVDVAQHGGHLAQTTSVPGVAQRTGATVYYLELFPRKAAQAAGREPVLALMPLPGDVDVVLASELMEAARAVERGFVTPDKTLLITSTHRVFAMAEKTALADGRADSAALLSACRAAARQLLAFDMAALAEATRSVLSAVLLGALAGSGALPFSRLAFEAAIRRSQIEVTRSLAAFAAGFAAAQDGTPPVAVAGADARKEAAPARLREMIGQVERHYGGEERAVVLAGIVRLDDYQDVDYAEDFLRALERFRDTERKHGDGSGRLLAETARQLALAMAYEDVVRVAELKIRSSRFARVREEVQLQPGQILEIAEFFHPRVQEVADMLPAPLGRWLLRTRWARRPLERLMHRGRIINTTSVGGFLLLYALSRLKPLRRRSLRFGRERGAIAAWLDLVAASAERNYGLALQVARLRGLVKGYGDTHERGEAKFNALAALLPRLFERINSSAELEALIKAALADEDGRALRAAIADLAGTDVCRRMA